MRLATVTLALLLLVPISLFVLEWFLCKRKSKIAWYLPMLVACFFVLLGFYALMLAAVLFGIYFVVQYSDKKKASKLSELEKMNLEDL